jgi:hypothetical protein
MMILSFGGPFNSRSTNVYYNKLQHTSWLATVLADYDFFLELADSGLADQQISQTGTPIKISGLANR